MNFKTGNQATFTIRVANQDFSGLCRPTIVGSLRMDLGLIKGFKGTLPRLAGARGREELIISDSSVDTEHFRKNHLPNLAKQLEAFGFPHFTCQWSLMRELTEQEVARALRRKMKKIFKLTNEETLRAMESLAQMAPPPARLKKSRLTSRLKLQINLS